MYEPHAPASQAPASAAALAPERATETEDAFDSQVVLTFGVLLARHGVATLEEVNAYLEGADLAKLAQDGADVATPRISRDGLRIVGSLAEFLLHATEEQRALLPALTPDLLRVIIWCLYHGHTLYEQREQAKRAIATARAGRAAHIQDLRHRAAGYRDVLHAGLRILAGYHGDLPNRIEAAYNQSSQSQKLATTIQTLVRLGREVLGDTSPAAQQRRRGSRIDEAYLASGEALAAEVAALGVVAEAVPAQPPVLQEEVDLWDGRSLAFLRMVLMALDAGRRVDPRLPAVHPIALRGFFKRRSATRKAKPLANPTQGASPDAPRAPGAPVALPAASIPPPERFNVSIVLQRDRKRMRPRKNCTRPTRMAP